MPNQFPYIQQVVKRGTPGAVEQRLGKNQSSWILQVPNPNYKPAPQPAASNQLGIQQAQSPNWGTWQKGNATVSEHSGLINSYYQNYFGRNAQGTEISDWVSTNKTPAQIEAGLRDHPDAKYLGGGGGGGWGGGGEQLMPALERPPTYAPGGESDSIEGNAMGFKRKRSSARMAGLTTKGTSQFKISGQSAKSSGLNIGT
jgi:hypothetical protein